jgi:N-acetylmuramoyl-L-alanine amidase
MSDITIDGAPVRQQLTPNRSARSARVSLIVLHSTEGSFQGAVSWLCNTRSHASAHFVLSRSGEVVQLVPLAEKAWHAGRSAWQGRANVNTFSIGIEMEHKVDDPRLDDWPDVQVQMAAKLCKAIERALGTSLPKVGHAAIATPKGRKSDPKDFPWDRFSHFYHDLDS